MSLPDPIKILDPIKVLDHGYVRLIESMGTDESIIEAARMSTGKGFVSWDEYQECSKCGVILSPFHEMCSGTGAHDWKKKNDLSLLEFLWGNKHATPFEMCELQIEVQAPIMVFREWHRHRTQCLAGDTKLYFDLPGGIERRGTQKRTMTIREVFEKFQPTSRAARPERQTNAFFPRSRVQGMRLRCLNEETKEVSHTSITDVWESGVKKVYDVEVEGIGVIRASKDHRFFTDRGWLRLEQMIALPDDPHPDSNCLTEVTGECVADWCKLHYRPKVYTVSGSPTESVSFEIPATEVDEVWKSVVGWEEFYEVSNMGRVRRIAGGQGVRSVGTCKKLTEAMTGYFVTNLNRPGVQELKTVHSMVLEAFIGLCPDGQECRHLDGNQKNNWLENLSWGSAKENADDRSRHGRTPTLKAFAKSITSVKYSGEEMTFDIEVAEPWHNFVAEGFVVHNSYNEFSARYSVMPNLHYVPEESRFSAVQDSSNKQEASVAQGDLFRPARGLTNESMREAVREEQNTVYKHYSILLDAGVPKEVARLNTPVSRYSKMRAKTDLRNWLAFLNLRMRPNAQKEIREYAVAVASIVKELWPRTYALFVEYDLEGASFSKSEIALLKDMLLDNKMEESFEENSVKLGLEKKKASALYKKLFR